MLNRITCKKVVGPDRLSLKVWKILGRMEFSKVIKLFNWIACESKIPNFWRKSYLMPIYKSKKDAREYGNYRDIK